MGRIEELEAELQKLKAEEKEKDIERRKNLIGVCLHTTRENYEKIIEITDVSKNESEVIISYNCVKIYIDNESNKLQDAAIEFDSAERIIESTLKYFVISQEKFNKAFEDCVAMMRRRINQ